MGLDFWTDPRGCETVARQGPERLAHSPALSQSAAKRSGRQAADVPQGDGRRNEHGTTAQDGARRLLDRRRGLQQDPGPSVQGQRTYPPHYARAGGLREMATALTRKALIPDPAR